MQTYAILVREEPQTETLAVKRTPDLGLWDHPLVFCSLDMPSPFFGSWVPAGLTLAEGESEVEVKVAQSCLTLCDPMDCMVHGILQARILEWVTVPFSRGSSQPRSPTVQEDSSPAEPPGKPKNTGVGSLSLLQWIFPTQESNRGLLHCRWILYQLSYQESQVTRLSHIYSLQAGYCVGGTDE